MKTNVPEDNLDDDSDEFSKDYVEIRRSNEYLNSPQKNIRSSLSDTDFVRDGKHAGFKLAPLFRVMVKKGDEERDFIPLRFLELVLENYCILAEQTDNINDKTDILIKAENEINKYIRKFELAHFGLEYAKILDDLNDQLNKLQKYKNLKLNNGSNEKSIIKSETPKKLTLPQVALYCFYTERSITKENCDVIAEEYGHKSGHALIQDYSHYQKHSKRVGNEESIKKNDNKIKLFEVIISLFDNDLPAKEKATKDLKEFKKIIGK